ncbi:hypothetical protein FKG94_04710 [Exilibacterium tricleocarpae]|uniref:Uncharacterized protein n=1 Tax=Exilibacterium tricleocarpae TaxID=2591008 RepID=A0A545U5S3_9GAMM|nr:hypothetical protein [Exilibacterium tricleocarpae]TQV84819.1 hypothetical protein FKG94_04710 [Exilibacterium tricleocarpae]
MNDNLTQFLWLRLQSLFVSLVEYVCNSSDEFIHDIGKSSNTAFPLRAYLTFMKDRNGGEISITVDVINRNGIYFVEADICDGNDLIVAEGPTVQMTQPTENDLTSWLEKYEAFLESNQNVVKEKAMALE